MAMHPAGRRAASRARECVGWGGMWLLLRFVATALALQLQQGDHAAAEEQGVGEFDASALHSKRST